MSKIDSLVYLNGWVLKSISQHSKYALYRNEENTQLLIRNTYTKDTLIIENPELLDYNVLNDEYIYSTSVIVDTLHLCNINNKEKSKFNVPRFYSFIADNENIYYYDLAINKLVCFRLSGINKSEIILSDAVLNLSISYDGKFLLGVTPYNSVVAYSIGDWTKTYEVSYQNITPNKYSLSDNSKFMIIGNNSSLICFRFDLAEVEQELKQNDFTKYPLYPNPAIDFVNFNNQQNEIINSIELYNSNSELVKSINSVNSNYLDIF